MTYVEMICHLSDIEPAEPAIPTGFEVRNLSEADEDELYDCYYKAFNSGDAQFFFTQNEGQRRDFFDELGLEDAINEEASIILNKGTHLVGFAYVLPDGQSKSHISCMCVHPDFQGKGLGKLLLHLVLEKLTKAGKRTVTLGTETEMRAFKLYHNNGFNITG